MIRLTIIGDPAPQGSKRHVGHGVMVESSKRCKPWRESVLWQAKEQYSGPLLDGAIEGKIVFVLPRPKRLKNRLGVMHSTQPDLSKLLRAVEDSLTGVVWTDDSRVCAWTAAKRHADPGEHTGCYIEIQEVA